MPHTQNIYFGCGKKATLNNLLYEVTGVVIKKNKDNYFWTEYALYNKTAGWLYLNEYNEHWTLLTEISPNEYHHKCNVEQGTLWGNKYKLFLDDNDCSIAWATGLFGYQLPTGTFAIKDSIAPPLLISLEEVEGKISTFAGRYVTHKEMNATFTDIIFANTLGVGMVQPRVVNMVHFTLLMSLFALLVVVSSFFTSTYKVAKVVEMNIYPNPDPNYEYVSGSFTINRVIPSAIAIDLETTVDNSWIIVDVGLVNEKTNEVRYASEEVAYYHSQDSEPIDDAWVEGSKKAQFNICGVSSGTYHFVFWMFEPPEHVGLSQLLVTATWLGYSKTNLIWAMSFLIVSYIVVCLTSFSWEDSRWSRSQYYKFK